MHQRKNVKEALNQSDILEEETDKLRFDSGKGDNDNFELESKEEPKIMEEIFTTGSNTGGKMRPGKSKSTRQKQSSSCCGGGSICGVPQYDENDKGIKWLPLFFLAIFVMPLFFAVGDWLFQQDFMKPFIPAPTYDYCLENYFKQVNPSRVDKVSQFLDDYKGREDILFRKLERKYGVQVPCKL